MSISVRLSSVLTEELLLMLSGEASEVSEPFDGRKILAHLEKSSVPSCLLMETGFQGQEHYVAHLEVSY